MAKRKPAFESGIPVLRLNGGGWVERGKAAVVAFNPATRKWEDEQAQQDAEDLRQWIAALSTWGDGLRKVISAVQLSLDGDPSTVLRVRYRMEAAEDAKALAESLIRYAGMLSLPTHIEPPFHVPDSYRRAACHTTTAVNRVREWLEATGKQPDPLAALQDTLSAVEEALRECEEPKPPCKVAAGTRVADDPFSHRTIFKHGDWDLTTAGEGSYRGMTFPLEGVRRRILARLIEANGKPVQVPALAQDGRCRWGSVSRHVCDLRRILRRLRGRRKNQWDPIPHCDPASYKLDMAGW